MIKAFNLSNFIVKILLKSFATLAIFDNLQIKMVLNVFRQYFFYNKKLFLLMQIVFKK